MDRRPPPSIPEDNLTAATAKQGYSCTTIPPQHLSDRGRKSRASCFPARASQRQKREDCGLIGQQLRREAVKRVTAGGALSLIPLSRLPPRPVFCGGSFCVKIVETL
ncbi:Hypothetical predicted protein [Xyrichtys novacula]|uniref:Uncharacterized protein n=1 Tax=Xyrichtys novacula TaxID=13765 RepID=A0AAV1EI69_XYRNO|nr:Hypothetical predicted protein [Xyrichtys novacula]